MGAVHLGADGHRGADALFQLTYELVRRAIDFESAGFLLVDDEDATFQLVAAQPESARDRLRSEIDALIDSGEFAWAINRNHACSVPSTLSGRPVLLNVLATRNQVWGMFLGVPRRPDEVTDAARKLISIVLHNSAYALESASLYQIVSQQRDALEARVERRNRELQYQHTHDSLTGLANRPMFLERVRAAIDQARANQACAAVIYLDLRFFQRVNESLSYLVGDQLLKGVAQRLRGCLASEPVQALLGADRCITAIARLGGDEFGVLLSDVEHVDSFTQVVREIIAALSKPYRLGDQELHVDSSIGLSAYPTDGEDAETLIKHAAVAMSHARQRGQTNYKAFSPSMTVRGLQVVQVENELRRALQRDEFVMHYQPKIEILSDRIVGAEALIRWQHPTRGLLAPGEFIPLAESSGLIEPLGEWAMGAVCRQLSLWRDSALAHLKLAVNLSSRQFQQTDLVSKVMHAVQGYQISPRQLELELTETTITRDVDAAVRVLYALHELGFTISVDDFGTGYSSLSLLRRFPIDAIKIDRSFVGDITRDADDAAIVNAVVAMGQNLRLRVIAEGVESQDQLAYLTAMGCHEIQGYYASRPIPADEFRVLYEGWSGLRVNASQVRLKDGAADAPVTGFPDAPGLCPTK
jgi:diguanylate cyclase (GGDEF)-like protein